MNDGPRWDRWQSASFSLLTLSRFSTCTETRLADMVAENAGIDTICHPEQGCPNDDVQERRLIPAELKCGGCFTKAFGHRTGPFNRQGWLEGDKV